jgi:23S rRNA U2552 (ribose-2'-O)-methylase RlmE/FtsJ
MRLDDFKLKFHDKKNNLSRTYFKSLNSNYKVLSNYKIIIDLGFTAEKITVK